MKIRKIMALMLLSGCLIVGTNIAYADCKDTRTIEWEIPADGHFDFTDLRKIEGNENKSDEELKIPYCPPTVAYDPNTNSYHETCYTEEMCLSNRYRFDILDPNNFSENVECTPEKPDIPNEPEKPIVPNVPNNTTPTTPSNIPSNNSTSREKTNPTVIPKQNNEKTPVTIINTEEKVITENDFQEGKNPNSLIKRDIKTGDNLFTITILMFFGILGLGGNWFCNKLDNIKKKE